jgi:hypothetical protein
MACPAASWVKSHHDLGLGQAFLAAERSLHIRMQRSAVALVCRQHVGARSKEAEGRAPRPKRQRREKFRIKIR